MTEQILGLAAALYFVAVVPVLVVHDELPGSTSEAQWSLALILWLVTPLTLVALVLYAIARAGIVLGRGFGDLAQDLGELWRAVVPKRPKVPKATARRKP